MEENEIVKYVRVTEIKPVEIRCEECNEVIGEAVQELNTSVYCEGCYTEMKDKRDGLEENLRRIHDIAEE